MSEIKVGEYVRTKQGYIVKIEKILGKDSCYKNMEHYQVDTLIYTHLTICFIIYKEDILKHSFNIIDLIEVGDYVNGEEVIKVDGSYVYVDEKVGILDKTFVDYQIKSIVTKERFKESEYKIV